MMPTLWTLVLIFYGGGKAAESVPNFMTRDACQQAARLYREPRNGTAATLADCFEVANPHYRP